MAESQGEYRDGDGGGGAWEAEGDEGVGGLRAGVACAAEVGVVLDLHLVDLLLTQVQVHLLARHLVRGEGWG